MKKGILLLLAAFLAVSPVAIRRANAVPAYPHPITVTQSDGTQLTIRIVGDEFNHYTLNEEGYTIINDIRGDYYYARLDSNGELAPTAVRARPISRLTAAERSQVMTLGKALKPTAVSPLRMQAQAQAPSNSTILLSSVNGINPPGRISAAPTKGKIKSLVILMEFSDVQFTVPSPQQAFTNLLNQDGYSVNGATGSAWNYYHANSNSQFDPEFIVIGPYRASGTTKDYAGAGGTQNVMALMLEACRAADATINFAEYADNGVIRDVFIFFAGHNQAEGAGKYTIWPHRSSGWSYNLDGAILQGYACSSEYKGAAGNTMAGIGTFCHEFGHVMGWPDFYDTDYDGSGGNAPALENYSLMCSGSYNNDGRTPPAVNILERWMVGWTTPTELVDNGNYTLQPVTADKGHLVRTSKNNDYFLFEYRGAGKTVWDNPSYIGGVQGMMVYHVDYIPYIWEYNNINNDPSHECMRLIRSVANANKNPGRTIFPGSSNVTSLSPVSHSHYNAWNGAAPDIKFTNIAVTNNTAVTFTILNNAIPNWRVQTDPYPRDLVLRWEDSKATGWNVTWRQVGATTDLGSQTVNKPEVHIGDLIPATNYAVTITPSPVIRENPAQSFTFSTNSNSSKYASIGLSEYQYSSSQPILLTANVSDDVREVKWYIDGQLTTSTFRALPVGEHKISLEITQEDGSKEYVIKYIQVVK